MYQRVKFLRKLSSCLRYSPCRHFTVLGIETSCDDTGVAVVDSKGNILGESLHSQELVHLRNGGIIPPIARDLHVANLQRIVDEALERSGRSVSEVDAIAATVKPGLSLSLLVGARYGQHLAQTFNRPFIPIHHMEAHALSVRMVQQVDFPFLVLLISGGHCLLAIAEDIDQFKLLGQSLDDAPGEAMDKVARRLKLSNLSEYRNIAGGPAMEKFSKFGESTFFEFPPVLTHKRDCNFSFSGLKNVARRYIIQEEKNHDIPADALIPTAAHLCASFQAAIGRHLCHRVQRAMEYVQVKDLLSQKNRYLVVAGGVACNKEIQRLLKVICSEMGYELAVPPRNLCTDNGLMIAWNGVERFRKSRGIISPEKAHTIDIEARCSFGEDHTADVIAEDLKCRWIKLPANEKGENAKAVTQPLKC